MDRRETHDISERLQYFGCCVALSGGTGGPNLSLELLVSIHARRKKLVASFGAHLLDQHRVSRIGKSLTAGSQRNHQRGDRCSRNSGAGGFGFSMAGHSLKR
jgi:hypothetical protein